MKTIGIGLGTITFVVLLTLILLLAKLNVGDIMYSMLGAAFVSIFASGFAISQNVGAFKVCAIVLFSIISGATGWLFSLMLLKITTVSLYGITALAFDLMIGVVSAITVSSLLIEKFTKIDVVR